MKKIIILVLFALVLILTGCTNDTENSQPIKNESEQETDDTTEVNPEQPQTEEPQTEESTDDEVDEDVNEETNEDGETSTENVEPLYEISENWSVVPIEEGVNEKVVLLTIDDAPDEHAVEMAKTLKSLDAPAIFFVNGHFLDTDEEKGKLKEIHDMGFEIGNHTYNHTKLDDVSEDEQRKEIVELNDLVEEIIGERPKYFRAPHGVNTDFVKTLVEDEGMVLMNWTYGYDYFQPYMDAEKLEEAMVTGEGPLVDVPYSLLKSGANLLMHDREWTSQALEGIVKGLREQGYETVDPRLIKTP